MTRLSDSFFVCLFPLFGLYLSKWIRRISSIVKPDLGVLSVPCPQPLQNTSTTTHRSDQIRSVPQSCPTLCDPMNRSTPGLPVHHQLPEFTQTHVHRVSDAIQPSHPLSSPSPLVPNPSQHQSLFP